MQFRMFMLKLQSIRGKNLPGLSEDVNNFIAVSLTFNQIRFRLLFNMRIKWETIMN